MKKPSKKFCAEYAAALEQFINEPKHGGITPAQIIALWKIRYEHADASELRIMRQLGLNSVPMP